MADEKVRVVEQGGTGSVIALMIGIVVGIAVLCLIFGTDLLRHRIPRADAQAESPR